MVCSVIPARTLGRSDARTAPHAGDIASVGLAIPLRKKGKSRVAGKSGLVDSCFSFMSSDDSRPALSMSTVSHGIARIAAVQELGQTWRARRGWSATIWSTLDTQPSRSTGVDAII